MARFNQQMAERNAAQENINAAAAQARANAAAEAEAAEYARKEQLEREKNAKLRGYNLAVQGYSGMASDQGSSLLVNIDNAVNAELGALDIRRIGENAANNIRYEGELNAFQHRLNATQYLGEAANYKLQRNNLRANKYGSLMKNIFIDTPAAGFEGMTSGASLGSSIGSMGGRRRRHCDHRRLESDQFHQTTGRDQPLVQIEMNEIKIDKSFNPQSHAREADMYQRGVARIRQTQPARSEIGEALGSLSAGLGTVNKILGKSADFAEGIRYKEERKQKERERLAASLAAAARESRQAADQVELTKLNNFAREQVLRLDGVTNERMLEEKAQGFRETFAQMISDNQNLSDDGRKQANIMLEKSVGAYRLEGVAQINRYWKNQQQRQAADSLNQRWRRRSARGAQLVRPFTRTGRHAEGFPRNG